MDRDKQSKLLEILMKNGIKDEAVAKDIISKNQLDPKRWVAWINDLYVGQKRKNMKRQIQTVIGIGEKIYPAIVVAYKKISPLKEIPLNEIQNFTTSSLTHKEIREQFNYYLTERIKTSLNRSNAIQQYFFLEINQIVGLINRRQSLVQYYNILVFQSALYISKQKDMNQNQKKKIAFLELFKSMKFIDFIILLTKITQKSQIIPNLLSRQIAPVPIYFIVENKIQKNIQILKNIFGSNTYPLILNLRSQKTVAQQSSKIFQSLMSIDQAYTKGSAFSLNFNFYKNLKIQQKQFVMIDFILNKKDTNDGSEETALIQKDKHQFINSLVHFASKIIFHLDLDQIPKSRKQIINGEQTAQTIIPKIQILQDYKYVFARKNIIELIVQNQGQFDKLDFINNHGDKFLAKNVRYFYLKEQSQIEGQKKAYINSFTSNSQLQNISYSSFKSSENAIFKQIKQFVQSMINKPRQKIFIKLFIQQMLNKTRLKIKSLTLNQYEKQITQLKTKEKYYQNQLTKTVTSTQILSCISYIKADTINMFYEVLSNINSQKIANLKGDYDNKKKKYQKEKKIDTTKPEQLQKLLTQLQQSKYLLDQQFLFTVGNIIRQISIYSELTIDVKAENPITQEQISINSFYTKSLEELTPINVINGESSNFGNKSLQRFFENLHKIYRKNDIFVISFIGPSSSGKSTLIGFLFRYNIFMKQISYAKGLYISLCKFGDKCIVLLDSQGIMTIDYTISQTIDTNQLEKFARFDHQIASIIMKKSDVVMFVGSTQMNNDNKQRIQMQLQLIIGICYKILDAINTNDNFSSESNQIQLPKVKKILFALNTNGQQINKKQLLQEMLKNLKLIIQPQLANSQILSDITEIRNEFNKYIRLQQKDILSIPKIFIDNKMNQQYVSSILYIRSRILQSVVSESSLRYSFKKMNELYKNCDVDWNIILLTTSSITRYKSLTEANLKRRLLLLYQSQYKGIYNNIYQDVKKSLQSYFSSLKTKISENLVNIIQKNIQHQKNKKTLGDVYQNSQKLFENIQFQPNRKLQDKLSQFFNFNISTSTFPKIIKDAFSNFDKQALLKNFSDNKINSTWIDQFKYEKGKRLMQNVVFRFVKQNYIVFHEKLRENIILSLNRSVISYFQNYRLKQQIRQIDNDKIESAALKRCLQLTDEQLKFKISSLELQYSLIHNFKSVLQSETVLLKELQIKHIKDCIEFSRKVNYKFMDNLNSFVIFSHQDLVTQSNQGKIIQQIKKTIDSFRTIVKEWLNKNKDFEQTKKQLKNQKKKSLHAQIIATDIRYKFGIIKQLCIEAKCKQLQVAILNLSRSIYTSSSNEQFFINITNIAFSLQKKRIILQKISKIDNQTAEKQYFINLQKILHKNQKNLEAQLTNIQSVFQEKKKKQKNKDNIQAINQELIERKIFTRQIFKQKDYAINKQIQESKKIFQDLRNNKISRQQRLRQIKFILRQQNQMKNFYQKFISLNVINFKILLLAQTYFIFEQLLKEESYCKATIQENLFNENKQSLNKTIIDQIKQTDDLSLQIAFKKDLQQLQSSLQKQYQAEIQRSRNQLITDKVKNINYRQQMKKILQNTLQRVITQNQRNDTQKMKDYYRQCYKMVKKPVKYYFQSIIKNIISGNELQALRNQAELDKKKYLSNIQQKCQNLTLKHLEDWKFSNLKKLYQKKIMNLDQLGKRIKQKIKELNKSLSNKDTKLSKQQELKQKNEAIKIILQKSDLMKNVIGCKQCCPMCGAKCILSPGHTIGHEAYSHNILAFGGCVDINKAEFIVQNCLTQNIVKKVWTSSSQNCGYLDCLKMINTQYNQWQNDLPSYSRESLFKQPLITQPLTKPLTQPLTKPLTQPLTKPLTNPKLVSIWANIEQSMIDAYNRNFAISDKIAQQVEKIKNEQIKDKVFQTVQFIKTSLMKLTTQQLKQTIKADEQRQDLRMKFTQRRNQVQKSSNVKVKQLFNEKHYLKKADLEVSYFNYFTCTQRKWLKFY